MGKGSYTQNIEIASMQQEKVIQKILKNKYRTY
jgi:hypothetical protein